jgi:trehalose synthase
MLEMVEVAPHPPERFESVLEPEPFEKLSGGIHEARELLGERTVWNVSSTAKGGGVVELLLPLIGYAKGAGVDARWAVIEGNPGFFKVTKRIHNHLHGFEGDGGKLDDEARKTYEDALEANASELVDLVKDDDVVLLHDPQTAGLIGPLKRTGAKVIWRCHIGVDEPDDSRAAPGTSCASTSSRPTPTCSRARRSCGRASTTTRCGSSPRRSTRSTPRTRSSSPGRSTRSWPPRGSSTTVTATRPSARGDGSEARVESQAELFEDSRLTTADKIVLQVSRWDRLEGSRRA